MGICRVLGVSENHEDLWNAFKTTILDVAGECLLTPHQVKRKFVSQWTMHNIDQSRRTRLDGRTELIRKPRRKTVRLLGVYRKPICKESVEG